MHVLSFPIFPCKGLSSSFFASRGCTTTTCSRRRRRSRRRWHVWTPHACPRGTKRYAVGAAVELEL